MTTITVETYDEQESYWEALATATLTQPIDPTGDPIDGDPDIEHMHWQQAQDDAEADRDDDNPVVGICYNCESEIRCDQHERTTRHTQSNGCDVDLGHYRCTCGTVFVTD